MQQSQVQSEMASQFSSKALIVETTTIDHEGTPSPFLHHWVLKVQKDSRIKSASICSKQGFGLEV